MGQDAAMISSGYRGNLLCILISDIAGVTDSVFSQTEVRETFPLLITTHGPGGVEIVVSDLRLPFIACYRVETCSKRHSLSENYTSRVSLMNSAD